MLAIFQKLFGSRSPRDDYEILVGTLRKLEELPVVTHEIMPLIAMKSVGMVIDCTAQTIALLLEKFSMSSTPRDVITFAIRRLE